MNLSFITIVSFFQEDKVMHVVCLKCFLSRQITRVFSELRFSDQKMLPIVNDQCQRIVINGRLPKRSFFKKVETIHPHIHYTGYRVSHKEKRKQRRLVWIFRANFFHSRFTLLVYFKAKYQVLTSDQNWQVLSRP